MTVDPESGTARRRTGLAKLRGTPVEAPPFETPPVEAPVEPPVDSPPVGLPPDVHQDVEETERVFPVPPEDEATAITAQSPNRRSVGRRLITVAAALIVVLAVLLTFVVRWGGQLSSSGASKSSEKSVTSDDNARFAALQAGRQFAVSFFTYDYRDLNAYFRRVETASTGSFRSDFVSKEATLKTVVTRLKTVATGQVPDSGAAIFAEADGKAVVFVAANLNASNAVTKNGQQRYRIKLSLQLVKGAWLVTDFSEVI